MKKRGLTKFIRRAQDVSREGDPLKMGWVFGFYFGLQLSQAQKGWPQSTQPAYPATDPSAGIQERVVLLAGEAGVFADVPSLVCACVSK